MVVNKKIVVIDDEPGICDILRKLLEREGYVVMTSLVPQEGLKLVEDESPGVVLLDIKMPGMDGVEVLSKIKEKNKDIAVIMITGYGNIETAMESMKLGAYDYITKPFDLDFIKNLVARCLK